MNQDKQIIPNSIDFGAECPEGGPEKYAAAILIDPTERTLRRVWLPRNGTAGEQLAALYAAMECTCVDVWRLPFDAAMMYIDDEGMLKAPETVRFFSFDVDDDNSFLFAGRALVVGPTPEDGGEDGGDGFADYNAHGTHGSMVANALARCIGWVKPEHSQALIERGLSSFRFETVSIPGLSS